jgi:hypothetical protein
MRKSPSRRLPVRSTPALLLALLALTSTARGGDACAPDLPTHGTTVRWHADADAARAAAVAERKLLFVLHLSGELAIPDQS